MPNNFLGLQIKEGMFDSVPHIMLDGKKIYTNRQQPQAPPARPPAPYQQPVYPSQPRQPKQPEDLVDKLKKYALIVLTCLVLGAAVYMVIEVILGRFF